ncbi:hypothetical protein MN116_004316 [Schistosoma mekongi]|uniref:ADF-H domain-containing protein n=1 Tax=Schistosoma mekongi TaxID=38744 RepID=A0AAE1ZFY8_SCHME|nr:hypothetical protein MN116_004316 [Schistosoma mekongi]
MDSGIRCQQSCIEAFEALKIHKHQRYLLFRICNKKEIEFLAGGDRKKNYDDLKNELIKAAMEGDGRYAVYDYETEGQAATLIFILWVPSSLDPKVKLLYAASKEAFKAKLDGVKHEVQINDVDEIDEQEIYRKVHKLS